MCDIFMILVSLARYIDGFLIPDGWIKHLARVSLMKVW